MILSCSFKHSPMTICANHGINGGHFYKMLIEPPPQGPPGEFFPQNFLKMSWFTPTNPKIEIDK